MTEEQNINQLPKNWKWVKLGEIAKVKGGKRLPKGEPYAVSKTKFPYLRVVDFENMTVNQTELKYLNEHTQKQIKNYTITSDDLYISIAGTIGRVGIIPQTLSGANLTENAAKITEIKELELKYLALLLNSHKVQGQISEKTIATTQPKLALYRIEKLVLPVPPKEEQQQIVSKIEELFSELDKGIEELKTAQQQLKVYRQAVLKWAFEGKLTNEDVKDGELPDGWKHATIGDVCTSVEYGSSIKSKKAGRVPVLRMGNIQKGIFEWDDLVYTDDDEEIKKYSLKKNDILFNRTNSAELVGKTAIYKGERPAIFAGYLIRINRIETLIDASYLTYYLNSKDAKSYGNKVRSFGVNQSNINGTKLKTYPFSLPLLGEQQQIVQEIESRLSVCDKIEETIINSLKQSEALRQSILKKAFEGRLL